MELPENTVFNEYGIKLKNSQQLPYKPIYSLGPAELEILNIYIKTHLKTEFIILFKSSVGAFILFDKKFDSSFYIHVDYQGLNNLIIKNQYSIHLINKSLDQLGQAKRFIQLDLNSAYHQMKIKEENKQKNVFQTLYNHFKYQVMLFGLSNIPVSFQSYINKILAKKLNNFVIIYLNNILIYTKDLCQGHVTVVQ